MKQSVATLGWLHPCQSEERCSETMLITVQQHTKEAHQKSSIIWGLLNDRIKREIMGRLGRSLEGEALENWGQQHPLEELIFLPHLLLRQPLSNDVPALLQYDCMFRHVTSLYNRNLTPPSLPPSMSLCLLQGC